MNTTLKKSVKSYGSFLKNFFLRAFTFSKGEEFNDSNSSFDNKSDDELLHSDNKNVDKGPRKEDENDKLKEEAIMSPGKVAFRNYFRNPLGIIGLVLFVAIVLVVFVGSKVLPFNQYYSQGNLTNVAPGGAYMNYPSDLEKEGV